VKPVAASELPAFIRSTPVAILYLGYGGKSGFSAAIAKHFEAEADAALGAVDLTLLNMKDRATASWVRQSQKALDWDTSERIPSGYYLFIGGVLRAFHPGQIDFANDKASLWVGLAAGIAGVILKAPMAVRLGLDATNAEASARVVSYFDDAIREWRSAKAREQQERFNADRQRTQVEIENEALVRAFTLLGLKTTATRDSTKAAFRKLARQVHPDNYDGDPTKTKIANERMKALNLAFELIKSKRGWG